MKLNLCLLFLSIAASGYAAEPSWFYDADHVLDSIVNPGESKMVFAFDQWGYETLNETYSWSPTRQDWDGIYKCLMAFDEAGNNTMYESYNWNYDTYAWQPSVKSEYEYENGRLAHSVMYQAVAETGEWVPMTSNYFQHDAAGNQTYVEYNSWSADENAWVPMSKYVYAYDERNQVILAESWDWDKANDQWEGMLKVVQEYSGVINVMLHKQYEWDCYDKEWVLASQTEGEWNEAGTCWTLTEYAIEGDEKEALGSIFYYFNSSAGIALPTIGENMVDPFQVDFPQAENEMRIQVYDLSGKMIPSDRMQFLPKGIYIVNGKKVMK